MLCQLVCLDRRYQRMNCFNIREIQTLLKTRFYADLLSENHQHIFLNRSTPTLRFKTQELNFLNSCQVILHKYGILTTPTTRNQVYSSPFTATLTNARVTDTVQLPTLFNETYYTLVSTVSNSFSGSLNTTTFLNSFSSFETTFTKLTGFSKLLSSSFWSSLFTNLLSTVTGVLFYLQTLASSLKLNLTLPLIADSGTNYSQTLVNLPMNFLQNLTTINTFFKASLGGLKLFFTNLIAFSP